MLFISEHKKIDDSDDVADDGGRKIVFDNLDMYIQPHQTSEDNQNQDLHWVSVTATVHWVSVTATENRISGNHLPSIAKRNGIHPRQITQVISIMQKVTFGRLFHS